MQSATTGVDRSGRRDRIDFLEKIGRAFTTIDTPLRIDLTRALPGPGVGSKSEIREDPCQISSLSIGWVL